MIKARELRIGNLVKCVRHLPIGFHAPVHSYTEITEIREGAVETEDGVHKLRSIGPVKLTEEVLIKSGGLKGEDMSIVFKGSAPDSPTLTFLEEYGLFYLSDGNGKKISEAIEYVHHFQNVYYALMKTEIKVRFA